MDRIIVRASPLRDSITDRVHISYWQVWVREEPFRHFPKIIFINPENQESFYNMLIKNDNFVAFESVWNLTLIWVDKIRLKM